MGAELDDAASAGRFDRADSDVAFQHRLRLGQLQIELSSMHALWEHYPLDWLRHEDGLSLPLSS